MPGRAFQSDKMSDTRAEIEEAIRTLSLLPEQFRPLPSSEAEAVNRECLRRFTTATKAPNWWWEWLKPPTASQPYDDFDGEISLLTQLIPDLDAPVYFIAEDEEVIFPVYLTTTRQVMAVLGECFFFEYYLTPPDYAWLLCSTHHNDLIGAGEMLIPRFQNLN